MLLPWFKLNACEDKFSVFVAGVALAFEPDFLFTLVPLVGF